jgi:hypothetical protein
MTREDDATVDNVDAIVHRCTHIVAVVHTRVVAPRFDVRARLRRGKEFARVASVKPLQTKGLSGRALPHAFCRKASRDGNA